MKSTYLFINLHQLQTHTTLKILFASICLMFFMRYLSRREHVAKGRLSFNIIMQLQHVLGGAGHLGIPHSTNSL